MSTELLQSIAGSNLWWAIGPEMILACAALGLLVIEITTPKEQHRFIPYVAIASLVMLLRSLVLVSLLAPFALVGFARLILPGLLASALCSAVGADRS